MFVFRSVSSYTLDNTLSSRLSDQQLVGNYEDRYLLRATMGWFRGISIGIGSNNRVRAAAAIACCATDMIVSIDSYLGHQRSLKIIPYRLPWYRSNNTFLSPTIDTYWLKWQVWNDIDRCLLVNLKGWQGCRSIPIAQLNRFARLPIDTYCSIK